MSDTNDNSTIDLAPSLKPAVPVGDDPAAASHVLNAVLDATQHLSETLREIGNRYYDDAPVSSAYVLDLSGALAGTVLDWIVRWPS